MLLHIRTFRVLDIQNILTQYQMLTFFDFQNICFSIYTHFTNRFFRLFVIFKKIFNRKKRLFFDQYQKFNFLDSQNICPPPYRHISCSVYTEHFKIGKNFVPHIRYIFDQYQMLTFCILASFKRYPILHIVTFFVPQIRYIVIFK